MMSNNTYSNNFSSSNPLAKEEELQKFENSFFPAGGAPQLANIPQAPPAPTHFNNVRSTPMKLKTRNWGPKLENGYGGLNRSLYDRPNVLNWETKPILGERPHLNNNNVLSSFLSSSTSTASSSRSIVDNIPSAIAAPVYRDTHNHRIRGQHLRTHHWGHPTAEGWSGMNRELYNNGMRLERDVLMNELRYKYGPRPNFQQQERAIVTETFVETVPTPITTTTLMATGPAKVLATTVPVPMLNPPINDGRRYEKLYKRNTNALASEKGLTKLVKRRGTRRDHLVQPTTIAPMTSSMPYTTSVAPYPTVAPMSTFAPAPSKAQLKRERKAQRSQLKLAEKEQRAVRKTNKGRGVTIVPGPSFHAGPSILPIAPVAMPIQSVPIMSVPTSSFVGSPMMPATTSFVGSPALQNATFVGETRTVLTQEATFLAPTTMTTAMPLTTPVGVSAEPLDHAHVLAGQLGNAPVKRPRRARKAKRGTEQPLYSNVISSTPAPLTAITTTSAVPSVTTSYTSSSFVDGTTVVQPATLVGETRNIIVDQGMMKQDYNVVPAIAPLAMGNPVM